jgi:hypothetical protein
MATAKVKLVAVPDDFDGRTPDLDDFISQIEIYFFGHAMTINTDSKKVLFTLGKMKEGLAMTFRLNYLRERKTAAVAGTATTAAIPASYNFETWTNFVARLYQTFQDPNDQQKKQLTLELLRQGDSTAEEFFLVFEQTRLSAGLTDKVAHWDKLLQILEKALAEWLINRIYLADTFPADYDTFWEKVLHFDALHQRWITLQKHLRQECTNPQYRRPDNSPYICKDKQTGTGTTYGGMGAPMDLLETT